MNDINVAHLHYYLSGDASNADPNASLGGEISATRLQCQSGSGLSNITGVTIDFAAGNAEGAGQLKWHVSSNSFSWVPFGGSEGDDVIVTEDGLYGISGLNGLGLICLDVDFSSLPMDDENDTITISNVTTNLFDNVSKADSFNGDTEYRCYYITNVHDTDSFLDIVLFVGQQPTPPTIAFGKDAAGVGDGINTGVAVTVANENTAPVGVTFSTANNEPAGVHVNTLAPGESIAVWLRRATASRNTVGNAEAMFVIDAQVYF